VNAAREAWFEGQLDLDPARIVFIDETAANTKMARLYGRAPRGERCRAAAPHGHWKTATFTAGLPSSRPYCAPLRREPSPTSGKPLPTLCAASPRKNAPTISSPLDTMQRERKMLLGQLGQRSIGSS
jgi:hypothetical protein